MSSPNILRAVFTISSQQLSRDELEQAMPINATDGWRMGESIGPATANRRRTANAWILASDRVEEQPGSVEVQHLVKQLLDQLAPYRHVLADLCSRGASTSMYVEVFCTGIHQPYLIFESDIIERLGEVSASLSVDLLG